MDNLKNGSLYQNFKQGNKGLGMCVDQLSAITYSTEGQKYKMQL